MGDCQGFTNPDSNGFFILEKCENTYTDGKQLGFGIASGVLRIFSLLGAGGVIAYLKGNQRGPVNVNVS